MVSSFGGSVGKDSSVGCNDGATSIVDVGRFVGIDVGTLVGIADGTLVGEDEGTSNDATKRMDKSKVTQMTTGKSHHGNFKILMMNKIAEALCC